MASTPPAVPTAGHGYALSPVGEQIMALGERLLGEDLRGRLARISFHGNEFGVDRFGFDPNVARYALLFATFLHRMYFRTEVHDIHRVPQGRVMLIANHSGQLPFDGFAIGASMVLDAEPPRMVRSMVERWVQTLPFFSQLFQRCGQIVGVPENCERLLEMEEAILVFPEGTRGISKTFDQRYQLADFGLGFMRLALATHCPIVPVALVGAEEQYINLHDAKTVAKVIGAPTAPVIPQWFIPGLQLPLPVRYRLYFGEPMTFSGDPDDDDAVIEEKVWVVKATIQSMLNRGLKERKGLFW
ncbi:MAG: acyltransferase family protein [Deltaproteobacteria bacterium]|nr:acyltransferase family protein [Deltaproteobacteria bacterium]